MSDDPMRILVVEPTKDTFFKEIDGSLASMQAIARIQSTRDSLRCTIITAICLDALRSGNTRRA